MLLSYLPLETTVAKWCHCRPPLCHTPSFPLVTSFSCHSPSSNMVSGRGSGHKQNKLTREEELLLQDFSRDVSTKSSALFYGNAMIISTIPICKFFSLPFRQQLCVCPLKCHVSLCHLVKLLLETLHSVTSPICPGRVSLLKHLPTNF